MFLVNKLSVIYDDVVVGSLVMDETNKRICFQYDKGWLRNGFSISPISLPLKDTLFIANPYPFNGNFGVFEDSLPDGYGRYLLDKILKNKGYDFLKLKPIEWLSIVGSSGMGALRFVPESISFEQNNNYCLDELQKMALDTLNEKNERDYNTLYIKSGNSGGCRPKVLWKHNNEDWLVKFRHTYDPVDIGKQELLYNQVANEIGISVPEFVLLDDKYFATKRFDIENGKKIHCVTVAGILETSINPPILDYKNILSLTGYLTQDSKDVEEMYRRMVFNVLAENKDDHAKNFSFLYKNNKWVLSPAYDLTKCKEGYNGQHATSVNNNGLPDIDDLMEIRNIVKINEYTAKNIIQKVFDICNHYKILGERFKSPKREKKKVSKHKLKI